jgi:phage terminase large subunit
MIKLSECISPNFVDLHKQLKNDKNISELWLRGGRGSTKSSWISIQIVLGLMQDSEANAVAFRRYENEVRDSVFSQLQWAINKLGVDHLFTSYVSPFKIKYNPTGQVILFKASENPKKIKSIKLATGYIKYAWFEEVDQFNGMEEIRNIQQSVFRGTTKKQYAFFSYNPPKSARSWANAESKITKPGRVVHYSDYRSVPREWLGETFINNAEHLKATNPEAYEHEYLGKETGTGLEVFNNVTLRPITAKEIEQFDNREQGLDFGYAADPLCFEEGHFDPKYRKLYLFSEISGLGMKNSTFASKMSAMQRTELTMADSQEPKSIDELREEHGVNVVGAAKAPGSVAHGIKYLQDLEEIVIDPARCPLAAKEFINYALDTNRYGETISKYPDKDNHSIDAVRYMMSQHIIQARMENRKGKFKVRRIPVLHRW